LHSVHNDSIVSFIYLYSARWQQVETHTTKRSKMKTEEQTSTNEKIVNEK